MTAHLKPGGGGGGGGGTKPSLLTAFVSRLFYFLGLDPLIITIINIFM